MPVFVNGKIRRRMRKRIPLILCMTLLFPSTLLLQAHFLHERYGEYKILADCPWCEDDGLGEDVVYVPFNASTMRLLSPADPHFLADLLWLRTVYYFGQHAFTDRQYPYLLHLLDVITDLSPEWEQPYLFGAVVLPVEAGAVEDGFYLIDKGLAQFPQSWELWFYKGFCMWQFRGDIDSAARALQRAALLPGSPPYLAPLAATLATRAGQRELALRFLNEVLDNLPTPDQRKIVLEKLREISGNAKNGA